MERTCGKAGAGGQGVPHSYAGKPGGTTGKQDRLGNLGFYPTNTCPARKSLSMEGQTKCFSDKVKLKEFIITKPLLYEMLQGLI